MFELMDAYSQSAVIKVIGVGGGGGNAVAHMVTAGIDGVEFMCINTDSQALKHAKVKTALQIGCNITKVLGAGADHGIGELTKFCDSLITIPNQKLLTVLGPQTTLLDAFKAANQVLQGAVQGIAELITRPGLINVDFADVRTVMAETGMAMMGSG